MHIDGVQQDSIVQSPLQSALVIRKKIVQRIFTVCSEMSKAHGLCQQRHQRCCVGMFWALSCSIHRPRDTLPLVRVSSLAPC